MWAGRSSCVSWEHFWERAQSWFQGACRFHRSLSLVLLLVDSRISVQFIDPVGSNRFQKSTSPRERLNYSSTAFPSTTLTVIYGLVSIASWQVIANSRGRLCVCGAEHWPTDWQGILSICLHNLFHCKESARLLPWHMCSHLPHRSSQRPEIAADTMQIQGLVVSLRQSSGKAMKHLSLSHSKCHWLFRPRKLLFTGGLDSVFLVCSLCQRTW